MGVKGVHPKHKNRPTVEIIIIVMTIITKWEHIRKTESTGPPSPEFQKGCSLISRNNRAIVSLLVYICRLLEWRNFYCLLSVSHDPSRLWICLFTRLIHLTLNLYVIYVFTPVCTCIQVHAYVCAHKSIYMCMCFFMFTLFSIYVCMCLLEIS